jgi:hypothetical protein
MGGEIPRGGSHAKSKDQGGYQVLRLSPVADHYYPALRTPSLPIRKDSTKSCRNRYAHLQAAILQHSVIDSFGGGIR